MFHDKNSSIFLGKFFQGKSEQTDEKNTPVNSAANITSTVTSENQLTIQVSEKKDASILGDHSNLTSEKSLEDLFGHNNAVFTSEKEELESDLFPEQLLQIANSNLGLEKKEVDFLEYTVVQTEKGPSPYELFKKRIQSLIKPSVSLSEVEKNYDYINHEVKKIIEKYSKKYLNQANQTAAIIADAEKALGNVSSDPKEYIFVQTDDVKNAAHKFLQSFFEKEVNCILVNTLEVKKDIELGKKAQACIAFFNVEITARVDKRYFCLVAVSSLGKKDNNFPKTVNPVVRHRGERISLWQQLEQEAENYNRQVFDTGINDSQNPIYIILDAGSKRFNETIERGLKQLAPYYNKKEHFPYRQCAEKAIFNEAAKLFFSWNKEIRITGALTAQFSAQENPRHGFDVLFSVSTGEKKTIPVCRQPLCPHCQRNKLSYIITMLAVKELADNPGNSNHLKESKKLEKDFPSPRREASVDYFGVATFDMNFLRQEKKRKKPDSEFLDCNFDQDGTKINRQQNILVKS